MLESVGEPERERRTCVTLLNMPELPIHGEIINLKKKLLISSGFLCICFFDLFHFSIDIIFEKRKRSEWSPRGGRFQGTLFFGNCLRELV